MISAIIFEKVLTIFFLIVIGFLCYKAKILDDHTKMHLSVLITQIVTPVLIFVSYQMDLNMDLVKNMGITFLLAVLNYFLAIGIVRLAVRRKEGYDLAVEKFTAIYSNCGFMGIPLAYGLYGAEGVVFATVYMTVFNIFAWTHGVVLMDPENSKIDLRKLISPSLIGIVLGLLFFFFQIRVPGPLYDAFEFVGDLNTPLAMLVSGVIIAQIHFREMVRHVRIYLITILRLVVIPLFFGLAVRFLPVDEMVKVVAMTLTACPTAALGIIFSVRFKRDDKYAAEIFSVTTLCSLLTIPLSVILVTV